MSNSFTCPNCNFCLDEEIEDKIIANENGTFSIVLLKELVCFKCGFKKKVNNEEC